jgi:hypothetical protein
MLNQHSKVIPQAVMEKSALSMETESEIIQALDICI